MVVDATRSGGKSAAFPAGPHPQHQVDVLPVCEQRLVEAPRGEERLPVERRRGAGRPDRVRDSLVQTRHGLAIQVVEDEEGPVELHSRRVDSGGLARLDASRPPPSLRRPSDRAAQ